MEREGMNGNRELLRELRSKMMFHAYHSNNLNDIAGAFQDRYDRPPKAFMVKAPYGLFGKQEYLKLLVTYSKCGANSVQVPLLLSKQELENTIAQLGEVRRVAYVNRRTREKQIELTEHKEKMDRHNYERHCAYCGDIFITDISSNKRYCDKIECWDKHEDYMLARRNAKTYRKVGNPKQVESPKPITVDMLPDFDLDDPSHDSLQGYVYLIRAENGLCKVGRSSDVENRFGTLVTMSPVPLYLEHTVFSDNYVAAEDYAHTELKEYRHHGEWFDLPQSVYEWFLGLDNYDLDTI
jgi:hypothetical protein